MKTFNVYITSERGEKIVKMASSDIDHLGIEFGTKVTVSNKDSYTVCIVVPADDSFAGKIGLNLNVAETIGVKPKDNVTIDICKYTEVYLEKATFYTNISSSFPNIKKIKDTLISHCDGIPLVANDKIYINIGGDTYWFSLKNNEKGKVMIINSSTKINFQYEVKTFSYHNNVGGMKRAKKEIEELVIVPLIHPEIYERFGHIKPPKGIIIHGPKGCGKSLLIESITKDVDVNFMKITSADIFDKFYGASENNLNDVFEAARKNQPCIMFIDEFEAIGSIREASSGQIERRVISEFLMQMDRIHKENEKIVVIGATNNISMIDDAFRRFGRFDYEILVNPPNVEERLEILQIHTKDLPLADDVNLVTISENMSGYVGADIFGVVTEAVRSSIHSMITSENITKPISPSKLSKVIIKKSDFDIAMKNVKPSIIRDSFIYVPDVKMSDIGGLDDCKLAIEESVLWRIKPPKELLKIGIKPPNGILLYGPHGCGKTLLGKAVANQAGANFMYIKGPELLSKWFGSSEKAIRDIFKKAKLAEPCIVFIDEMDAIAPIRGRDVDHDGGSIDRVVNQLLVEIDGVTPNDNVIVIGATNRPDIIDPAILRTGRFDYMLYVPPPDEKTRKQIFEINLKKMQYSKDIDTDVLASMTENCTGSDIEASLRHAGVIATREKREFITMEDIITAIKTKITRRLNKSMIDQYNAFKDISEKKKRECDLYT